MKIKIFQLGLIVCASALMALFCVSASVANLIVYDSGTNQWTISDFQATGVGNYTEIGVGLDGPGPHLRTGNGMAASWQPLGGWHYYNNNSEFTDFWHPDTLSWTVSGATWSNTQTNADGEYSMTSAIALLNPIADGTLLNGTFTWESNTGGGGTGVLVYTASVVPEPASATLLGLGGIGLMLTQRRRQRV